MQNTLRQPVRQYAMANKRIKNGAVVLVPMMPVTDDEPIAAFNKALSSHKKTIDSLK